MTRLLLNRFPFAAALGLLLGWGALVGKAEDFHIGPGQPTEDPSLVPWTTLMPGDTVYFHARPEPYRTKFVLSRRGEPGKPIRVVGVPDPVTKALPVLHGQDAITPPQLNYTQGDRAVIKIGSARFSGAVERPGFIEIEGLEITGSRVGGKFTYFDGKPGVYRVNAAAIHVETGDFITVRGCTLQNNSQGFTSSYLAHDILVERNHFYNNGNPETITEHSIYTESLRLTFLYNHMGPLLFGSRGNNLKDRSAGLVVGWNWIEQGNRLLDLVDSDHQELINAPEYAHTYVFGNILIKPLPRPLENNQVVHYGGDTEVYKNYRNGPLWFEHNTVISRRSGATVAFRLSTPRQWVILNNNLWSSEDPHSRIYLLSAEGTAQIAGPNWFPSQWRPFGEEVEKYARVLGQENIITGVGPKFVDVEAQDFRLRAHTGAVGKAGPLMQPLTRWPVATRLYQKHKTYTDLPTPNDNLGALLSDKPDKVLKRP